MKSRKISIIKWIDVRDQLPPDGANTRCLVSVSLWSRPDLGQSVMETEYDARDYESDHAPTFANIPEGCIVTHWAKMPTGAKVFTYKEATE